MAHPDRVTAIVSQNGNAYEEGLGDAWGPIRKYWAQPTGESRGNPQEHSDTGRNTMAVHARCERLRRASRPESYTLDSGSAGASGNKDIQLDLFLDYASNVKLYPAFQDYFRKAKPALASDLG